MKKSNLQSSPSRFSRPARRSPVVFEALEPRALLAGDVLASVAHGRLVLRGDAADNALVVSRDPAASGDRSRVLVSPAAGTTVNGSSAPLALGGIFNGVLADLGAGDDDLTLTGLLLGGGGDVKLSGGAGADRLLVRNSRVTGGVFLSGGEGADRLAVRAGEVYADLRLDGGLGRDDYALADQRVRGSLGLVDTAAPTTAAFGRVSVDGRSHVRTGNSVDRLVIDASTFKSDADVLTAGGSDAVKVRGTVFRAAGPINAGGEPGDAVDREIVLGWDFTDGAQGWEAGFSDYSKANTEILDGNGNVVSTDALKLRSGLRPLPAELRIDGTGFLLSGSNGSDNLFMFLSKGLTAADGLVPGARYKLSFRVHFASDTPAGLIGGGGAPAEAVFLKAGGAPRVPNVAPNANNFYTVDLEKGDQAFGGPEASVIGNIANGGPPQLGSEYQLVSHEGIHPNRPPTRYNDDGEFIPTDSNGNLWLTVGTDSGFEGITSLFYTAINVVLTPVDSAN